MNNLIRKIPSIILCAWALFCLTAAVIHIFLPDGGSSVIAKLPTNDTLIGIFAWAGATQLVWALTMMIVAIKYCKLTPHILCLIIIERIIISINAWYLKPPNVTGDQPPEIYITLYVLPILLIGFLLSLKKN